jgi:predicted ribosomally synthesized peptide with SipW-like signal peptide
MKKKIVLICVAAVAVAALAVGGTLAYLTATAGPATNTFAIGNITATLDENGDPNDETNKGDYVDWNLNTDDEYPIVIEPGRYVQKAPKIELKKGSSNAYVRITLIGPIDAYNVFHWDADGGELVPGYNTDDWDEVDKNSGVWYYKTVLKGSATENVITNPLFDALQLDPNITAYTDSLNIIVKGELLQADYTGTGINTIGENGADNAKDAFTENWPQTSNEPEEGEGEEPGEE